MVDEYCILLVEDNSADVKLFTSYINEITEFSTNCITVSTLKDTIEALESQKFDIVFLDLNLPDSKGFDTVVEIFKHGFDLPIVVLSGLSDNELALMAIKLGAQDYIVKDELTNVVLAKTLRYAVTRYRLAKQTEQMKNYEQQLAELEQINQVISTESKSIITKKAYGISLLSERAPQVFNSAVEDFSRIFDLTIESDLYKIEHDTNSPIKSLTNTLGMNLTGPKDIIQITNQVLKQKAQSNIKKNELYIQESRFLMIKLMGHLISFYRNYAQGMISYNTNKKDDEING